MLVFFLSITTIWTVLAIRSVYWSQRSPFLQPEAVPARIPESQAPIIQVVVPAHNEESTIDDAILGLVSQTYPESRLSIFVVNDRSTDNTGSVLANHAKRNRFQLIEGVERPSGWVGKTWAVHQGSRVALESEAQWLVFVDADVKLNCQAIVMAWRQAEQSGSDLVSLVPRYHCQTFWQSAIAVGLGHLLWQLYPLGKVNLPQAKLGFAHGNFIMVRRTAYEKLGGHESVRGEIVDDIQFAQRFKDQGFKLSVYAAPCLIQTHAYGNFKAIWHGLRKNAYAGMDYQFRKFFTGAIGGLILTWTPVLGCLIGWIQGSPWMMGLGIAGWLAQAVAAAPVCSAFRLFYGFGFAMPIGVTAYIMISAMSVWDYHRGRILWKDNVFATDSLRS